MSERYAALGDLVRLHRGQSYKSALLDEPGPVLLGLGTIKRNGGFNSGRLRTYGGESSHRILIGPGDIYLSLKDVTTTADLLGAVARVPDWIESGRLTQDTVRVEVASESVDPAYLFVALHDPRYRRYCRMHGTGTTNLDLSRTDFFAYELRLPPLPEQRAIAEVLGALDDKIAANRTVMEAAHRLARADFIVGSRDAPTVAMSDALESVLGGTPTRSNAKYWGGNIPWASAKDVAAAHNGVLVSTSECITQLAAQSSKARPVPAGSVILTARGTVGAVARLGVDSAFNQSCYGFVPGPLPSAVLYLTVVDAVQQLKAMVHGSVFDTITRRAFQHVGIIDPNWPGVQRLDSKVAPLLERVEQCVREVEVLAATRDALLPLLMSGKVRVKDVEDEVGELV